MHVLALIPARSGSKGIPDKNIMTFQGKPLLAHSVVQACQAETVTRTLVSTDSEAYAEIARQWGADVPFLRPDAISGDLATDWEVFDHALRWLQDNEGYCPEICVHLRPTYPTRRAADIDVCVRKMLGDPSLDSLRTVTPAPANPYKMWNLGEDGTLSPVARCGVPEAYNQPRQNLPAAYIQNANIDVVRSNVILQKRSMTGERIGGLVQQEFFDIDTWDEFQAAATRQAADFTNKTFVIDIDGVLATITPNNDYALANPIRANVNAVNDLYRRGNRIVLFTARGSATGIDWTDTTRKQMAEWGVNHHELHFGKPAADFYVDDRLIHLDEVIRVIQQEQDSNEERAE